MTCAGRLVDEREREREREGSGSDRGPRDDVAVFYWL